MSALKVLLIGLFRDFKLESERHIENITGASLKRTIEILSLEMSVYSKKVCFTRTNVKFRLIRKYQIIAQESVNIINICKGSCTYILTIHKPKNLTIRQNHNS